MTATPIKAAKSANGTAKVSLDLDALDREGAAGPFSIRHDGRVYTFIDAMDLDWQEVLLSLQNPHQFFRLTLPAADADAFLASKLPVWKMRRLMDNYREHHGMLEPGEAAASPAS